MASVVKYYLCREKNIYKESCCKNGGGPQYIFKQVSIQISLGSSCRLIWVKISLILCMLEDQSISWFCRLF